MDPAILFAAIGVGFLLNIIGVVISVTGIVKVSINILLVGAASNIIGIIFMGLAFSMIMGGPSW